MTLSSLSGGARGQQVWNIPEPKAAGLALLADSPVPCRFSPGSGQPGLGGCPLILVPWTPRPCRD